MITKIKIGTRESKLAVWQANYAKTKLESLGIDCELVKIKSRVTLIKLRLYMILE